METIFVPNTIQHSFSLRAKKELLNAIRNKEIVLAEVKESLKDIFAGNTHQAIVRIAHNLFDKPLTDIENPWKFICDWGINDAINRIEDSPINIDISTIFQEAETQEEVAENLVNALWMVVCYESVQEYIFFPSVEKCLNEGCDTLPWEQMLWWENATPQDILSVPIKALIVEGLETFTKASLNTETPYRIDMQAIEEYLFDALIEGPSMTPAQAADYIQSAKEELVFEIVINEFLRESKVLPPLSQPDKVVFCLKQIILHRLLRQVREDGFWCSTVSSNELPALLESAKHLI